VRLGYRYLSLKHAAWDTDTNIFPALFNEAIGRLNPDLSADDLTRLLADAKLLLDNEDLGKAFYERLTERSGIHPSRLNRFILNPAVTHSLPADFASPKTADVG
jgi:type I restriction enzyme R subunit